MDLYNNRIGRDLASDPRNKGRSSVDVILDALNKGMLRTKPYKVSVPPPGPLPKNWRVN